MTVFSLKSVGLVGCLFRSELDFFRKSGCAIMPTNPGQHFADLAMIENELAVLSPAPVPQVMTKIMKASESMAPRFKAQCTDRSCITLSGR